MKLAPRLSMETVLFLALGIALAAVLIANQPLDNRAIVIERNGATQVAQDPRLGVTVQDTGLRQ